MESGEQWKGAYSVWPYGEGHEGRKSEEGSLLLDFLMADLCRRILAGQGREQGHDLLSYIQEECLRHRQPVASSKGAQRLSFKLVIQSFASCSKFLCFRVCVCVLILLENVSE